MRKIVLSIVAFLFISINYAQDITGEWNGMLEAMKLRIVVHIDQTDLGYTATLDSPDQGATGIPITKITFENKVLNLIMTNLNATYKGDYSNGTFSGTFVQNGFEIPLILQRETIQKEIVSRPQEPKEPYPYLSEEVTFDNTGANITLAGTLTLPSKEGSFPVAILITGSGPQDRNEEIIGHKPFLVIADHLTRKGIAVLRFDDRGVGLSTGNHDTATSADFATDVLSAVTYLKTRGEIDKNNIGLIGHSEGGLIAGIVAAKNKDIAYVVSLAGPSIPGDQILLSQQAVMAKLRGTNDADILQSQQHNRKAFEIVKQNADSTILKEKMISYIREISIDDPDKPEEMTLDEYVNKQTKLVLSPWMVYFLQYDPTENISKIKCPVLALNGGKDVQVLAAENLPVFKSILESSGNMNITTKTFPELNHLFQVAATGAPSEYGTIEQTFAPEALDTISKWILEQVK